MRTFAIRRQAAARAARGLVAVTAGALLLGAGAAHAQKPAAAAAERDAKAIEALAAMGKSLRALKAFLLHADTTIDEVLDNGQKVQFSGTASYQVQAPNRMRVEVKSERKHRQFFYDGKSVTVFAPRSKYYGSVEAPATIPEALQLAEQKYGIEVPLADLFFWGTDKAGTEDIREAAAFGPERIGGVDCDHYAFRQEDVDWQVWVERGKRRLPCKIVITTTQEPAQPQYAAVLKWNVAPQFGKDAFRFAAPKDAKRITVAPAAGKN